MTMKTKIGAIIDAGLLRNRRGFGRLHRRERVHLPLRGDRPLGPHRSYTEQINSLFSRTV
jgi:hypothetical protein